MYIYIYIYVYYSLLYIYKYTCISYVRSAKIIADDKI